MTNTGVSETSSLRASLEEHVVAWRETEGSRLAEVDLSEDTFEGTAVTRLSITFSYPDLLCVPRHGRGRVFVRSSDLARWGELTLDLKAGYAIEDEVMFAAAARGGRILASTDTPDQGQAWPGTNPLLRGTNLDVAFLHVLRSLGAADDAKVVIGGGSAGGWMTLMLAAETFPLLGVAPNVPVVNTGYELRYVLDHAARPEVLAEWPLFAALAHNRPLLDAYGQDTNGQSFWEQSPVAVIDEITCPVSAVFSTADACIPIRALRAGLRRGPEQSFLDEGIVSDEAPGLGHRERVRLLDVLAVEDVQMDLIAIPAGAEPAPFQNLQDPAAHRPTAVSVAIPKPRRRWAITVVDEGAPEVGTGHLKHALVLERVGHEEAWARLALPGQLTDAKMRRLAARFSGVERLSDGLNSLDYPDAERRDVLRSLRTLVRHGGAAALLDAYARLPVALRCIPVLETCSSLASLEEWSRS